MATTWGEALCKVCRIRLMSGCEMTTGPPGFWLKMKLREELSEKSLTLTSSN